MTTRIPAWTRVTADDQAQSVETSSSSGEHCEDVRTGRVDESVANMSTVVPVTEAMVDEAVARVVKASGLPSDTAAVLKATLSRDTAGGVMHAYFSAKGAAARTAIAGVARKDLTISYVLTEQEILDLTEYAPEFRLKFHNRNSHDHAMAAATRLIDHKVIASRLPVGVPTSDIGGNPLVHIKSGLAWYHTCGPEKDVKDPMRHKMRKMEARVLVDKGASPQVVSLAQAYLSQDQSVCCRKLAQDCEFTTPVATAIHVYDIPMQDWPSIMERKGISLVEGCLLFSERFFEEREGVLGVSKARFEIDVAKDIFRMGFSDSPSWWYEHKFSSYMLYGTDQSIVTKTGVYAYKVIERRGDTVFFRILRSDISKRSLKPRQVSYKTPGVPVVRVEGFELSRSGSISSKALAKKDYFFPKNLWYEMVSQASEDYERGVMDYNKMYNHYRTISVKHTINAVLVMGGEQVSADELVPLVVHSCLAAAAQSLLGQRESRAMTNMEMKRRSRVMDGTARKIGQALLSLANSAAHMALFPFKLLTRQLVDWHYDEVSNWILEWEPRCQVITLEVGVLVAPGSEVLKAVSAQCVLMESAQEQAPYDHYVAVMQNEELRKVAGVLCPHVETVPSSEVGGSTETSLPSYKTEDTEQTKANRVADRTAVRLAAIREHIEEAHMQNRAVAYTCNITYRELTLAGVPNRAAIARQAEIHRNPDFWRVENGILIESVSGASMEQFNYSAVYHPRPDSDTGEVLRAVHSEDWTGKRPGSDKEVTNKNFVLGDLNFSGWVLVTDDLVVYNGPEIIASMEKSLLLPHDYQITLLWGPPGCGKTYKIIHEANPDATDAVMCPVRESIEDTRRELVALHKGFPDAKRYVRTVDSYLVNHGSNAKTGLMRVQRLLADECFMSHAGKWYAAAALLGASEILAYGDDYQIPHIPRVQAPKQYVKLVAETTREEWVTRRCPATAVAAWGSVYSWRVRTNKQEVGEMVEIRDTRGRNIPSGCVMMCMYQADKKELKKLYAADLGRIKIMTSHESEGKTFEHVWLHRFDNRKRSDKSSLFDQQPHVLVAMSRHTKSFVYRCPGELGDLVSQWVSRSKDPRRLAAASDLNSAGDSIEYL